MTYKHWNSANDVAIFRARNVPEHDISLQDCNIKSFKAVANTFDSNPKSKYRSWYLVPYCGLDVHNPTMALKSVKGPNNTIDFKSKWKRTLPSFDNFHGIFIGPTLKSKYQSCSLTPTCGVEVHNPTHALKLVKGPGNTLDLSPKWERTLPSFGNFSRGIHMASP